MLQTQIDTFNIKIKLPSMPDHPVFPIKDLDKLSPKS